MLEWPVSPWQFTAKIWSDTKCTKSLTWNHFVVELCSKVILKWNENEKVKWKWLLNSWNWPVFSDVSTEGLNDVILYLQPVDKKKNRGFCFLEYEDHKTAAQARRRLMSGKVKVWGNLVTVEWADPLEDPDPEVMAKVRVWLKATIVCVLASILFLLTLNFVWPSPGQGVIREEPGKQRHRGITGEGLQSVRQAGASEETQRLCLHPLWGTRWCCEGSDKKNSWSFLTHSSRWSKTSHYFHRLWLTSMAKTSRASTLKLFLPSLLIRRGKSAKLRDKLLKHTCKCCVG